MQANRLIDIAGTMIEAGSGECTLSKALLLIQVLTCSLDSTHCAINSMLLGLAAFPEVVEKAHEEVDRVVGDRMPQFEDSQNLPYIRAIGKEVLRWRSVSNDNFAHLTTVSFGARACDAIPR